VEYGVIPIPTPPYNIWVSEVLLPNVFEPLEYTIEEVTSCTCKSWAVNVPVTVRSPVKVSVVFFSKVEAIDDDTEVNEP